MSKSKDIISLMQALEAETDSLNVLQKEYKEIFGADNSELSVAHYKLMMVRESLIHNLGKAVWEDQQDKEQYECNCHRIPCNCHSGDIRRG